MADWEKRLFVFEKVKENVCEWKREWDGRDKERMGWNTETERKKESDGILKQKER